MDANGWNQDLVAPRPRSLERDGDATCEKRHLEAETNTKMFAVALSQTTLATWTQAFLTFRGATVAVPTHEENGGSGFLCSFGTGRLPETVSN